MNNQEYHDSEGFSSSQIKDFIVGPPKMFHAKHISKEIERVEKPAFNLGTAVHTMVLEPHLASEELAIEPTDINKRTKLGKQQYADWQEENKDKTILTKDQWDQAEAIAKALLANPHVPKMLEGSDVEQSVYVTDEDTGLLLKVRPDILNMNFVSDVKTAQSASLSAFEYSVKKFKYHVSAAMYLDVLRQAGYEMDTFFFAVSEKEPPYLTAAYVLSEDLLREGYSLYRQALDGIKQCIDTDTWVGYNNDELTVIGATNDE